ncbi:DUF502 domain-containing protein [Candidatus Sumerlaeota bacterium]|nr:DUF502 domain-containing protein [Candidatus Sumerlaeota bacterium]
MNAEAPSPEEQGQANEVTLPPHWGQMRPRFRNRVLAGLIFIVPLGVTAFAAVWIYTKIAALSGVWLDKLIDRKVLEAQFPEMARWLTPAINISAVVVTVFAIIVLLWFVGSFSSSFIIRRLMNLFERFVEGLPVVRPIYSFSKQVAELISRRQSSRGQRVVIIEYPKSRSYVLAFATGETRFTDSDELHVSLFVPTTPNPTSGFMLILPASEVRETNLTVEQAARIIMSGGIILPERVGVAPYGELEEAELPPVKLPEPREIQEFEESESDES